MDTLHLIVHKGMITEFPRVTDLELLDRIEEIESKFKPKYIPWMGLDNPASYDYEYWINLLPKSDNVILYGITRGHCVEKVADELMKRGVSVSYDIVGTA